MGLEPNPAAVAVNFPLRSFRLGNSCRARQFLPAAGLDGT
jgi:hypothetical protein